jgi:hypothetical protein
MTLMEVMVASAIFALLILMALAITHRTMVSFQEQIYEATLTHKGERTLKALQDDLSDATLIPVGSNVTGSASDVVWTDPNGGGTYTFKNAQINYKVPVRFYNPTINQLNLSVQINQTPVQPLDVNGLVDIGHGAGSSPPTFTGDFNFNMLYGWRDTARFVPNTDDGSKTVALQGPGLHCSGTLPTGVTGNPTPNGYCCYRFQPNPKMFIGKFGATGIYDEALEGNDLDGDGFKTSKYIIGYLERCYFVGNPGVEVLVPESRQAYSDTCVLQPCTSVTGAADQLISNRIFDSEANDFGSIEQYMSGGANYSLGSQTLDPFVRLRVCLWLLKSAADGRPHLMKCTTTAFMRNNAAYVIATSATGNN